MADTSTTSAPAPAGVDIDGARVRELRKLLGATVTDFAERCGISFQYLSQIERGDRQRVSAPVFAKICDKLGVEDRRTLLREAAA